MNFISLSVFSLTTINTNTLNSFFFLALLIFLPAGLSNSMMTDANGNTTLAGLSSSTSPNQSLFYSNLAPSAIGGQAVVTSPLLLGQSPAIGSGSCSGSGGGNGASSIGHTSLPSHSIYSSSVVSSSVINSSLASKSSAQSSNNLRNAFVSSGLVGTVTSATSSVIAATSGKKFTCKMCSQVRNWLHFKFR